MKLKPEHGFYPDMLLNIFMPPYKYIHVGKSLIRPNHPYKINSDNLNLTEVQKFLTYQKMKPSNC